MARQPVKRKYTDEQRAAIFAASFERDISYRRIEELAADGTLTGEPFKIRWDYAGRLIRAEAARRLGKAASPAAKLTAVDAVEHFRVRLVSIIESEINALEREKAGKRDEKKISACLRWLRELATIPGVKDARPEKASGSHTPGQPRVPDLRKGGAFGPLVQAFREQARNVEAPAEEAGASTSNESAAA